MSENKKKYIVVRNNTLDHKVGDEIELTEKRAKFLVGKVELKGTDKTKQKTKKNLVKKDTK